MTTIVINENSEEGRRLMKEIRDSRRSSDAVVRIFDNENAIAVLPYEPVEGVCSTKEELADELRTIEAAHDHSACIPHDDVMERMKSRLS